MVEDSNPVQATLGDIFRVVNELRKTQDVMRADQEAMRADQQAMRFNLEAMRAEQVDFRTTMEARLDAIDSRLGSQTESALNLALHVLGEQRGRLRELIDWANSKGARIERLP